MENDEKKTLWTEAEVEAIKKINIEYLERMISLAFKIGERIDPSKGKEYLKEVNKVVFAALVVLSARCPSVYRNLEMYTKELETTAQKMLLNNMFSQLFPPN